MEYKQRGSAKITKTVEANFPYLVDLSKDHFLFAERLEKLVAYKQSESYPMLTRTERGLIDEQIKCMDMLLNVMRKRMALY